MSYVSRVYGELVRLGVRGLSAASFSYKPLHHAWVQVGHKPAPKSKTVRRHVAKHSFPKLTPRSIGRERPRDLVSVSTLDDSEPE